MGEVSDGAADGVGATDDNVPSDADGYRSGFVSLVGRPNVGKSTLLNRILGHKVSIVSNKVQTTRFAVRGVLTRPDAQVVFVDTPGIHKPRSAMGERLNSTALRSTADVDVVCFVVDASAPFGRGDEWVANRLPPNAVVVVNKTDQVSKAVVAEQLVAAGTVDAESFFPVSARTGEGVAALVEHLAARMPFGPLWFPAEMRTDTPDPVWVAELVREQLLAVTRRELPHSIAARTVEWEWPRIRVEIYVERESQKPIVIGRGGQVLKDVGIRVRRQLPPGAYVELVVKVDRNWQRRTRALDELGY